MGDVSPSPHQLLVEAVVFWSIGVVIYIGRMYDTWKNWKLDSR